MRASTGAMITLLNAERVLVRADCYTIILIDGTTLRYTSADINLTIGADTFLTAQPAGGAPIIQRSRVKWGRGLSVDTMEMRIMSTTVHTVLGVPWAQFIRNGGLDGARIELRRFISDDFSNTAPGVLKWFFGNVAESEATRGGGTIQIKNDLHLLNKKIPERVYQAGCPNTLFDTSCGLNKATFALNRTVNAGSTKTRILTTSAGQAAGYFDSGFLFFTSGPNAGAYRTVEKWDGAGLDIALPLLAAPATGNAFTIYPGCPKTKAVCQSRFNNLIRYAGKDYVPSPETAA